MSKFTVRITQDVEFEVELEMEKYTPANFNGHPDNWSPEEGGEVNILSVKIVDTPKSETIGPDIADHLGKRLVDELTEAAVTEVNEMCQQV